MSILFFSVGNPGPMNRHSTGHYVLSELISSFGAHQLVKVKKGKYSVSNLDNVYFVKSNAYMNESGALLRSCLAGEHLGQCTIVVLCDDFDLNMPKIKLSPWMQNDSHNGVKSLWREIQASNITAYKLGIGIGPKPHGASKDTMASWVLSKFKPEETEELSDSMDLVYKYVNHIIQTDGNVGDCGKLNAKLGH